MDNRDKISVQDIERVTINLQIYCWYTPENKIKEWAGVISQEGGSWESHTNNQDLGALMRSIAGQVIIGHKIIKPWYNITLTQGTMPRRIEGVYQYTGKPPEGTERKALEYLIDEKEEIADRMSERRAYT